MTSGRTGWKWTAEREKVVATMWAAGHSAAQISVALGGGISRSGVIGKVYRLKLGSHKGSAVRLPPTRPATDGERGAAWRPLPGISPIGLMDLDASTCRWPIGDGPPYLFCGAQVCEGSYCANHAALSSGRVPVREAA